MYQKVQQAFIYFNNLLMEGLLQIILITNQTKDYAKNKLLMHFLKSLTVCES
jgi:hypothetical protein